MRGSMGTYDDHALTQLVTRALDESYQAERNPAMRYNMLLEFSSYLRQVRACACPGLLVCALRPLLLTGPHCLRRAPRIMIVEPKEAKA